MRARLCSTGIFAAAVTASLLTGSSNCRRQTRCRLREISVAYPAARRDLDMALRLQHGDVHIRDGLCALHSQGETCQADRPSATGWCSECTHKAALERRQRRSALVDLRDPDYPDGERQFSLCRSWLVDRHASQDTRVRHLGLHRRDVSAHFMYGGLGQLLRLFRVAPIPAESVSSNRCSWERWQGY